MSSGTIIEADQLSLEYASAGETSTLALTTSPCRCRSKSSSPFWDRAGADRGVVFHIVKVTTHVLDASYRQASTACRREAFGHTPLPTHPFIVVAGLAWPDMLLEVDVTAVVPA